MKKIISSIMILVITFISFGILNVKALDYNNQIKFNYRYSREINNTCYWISSSASGFTNIINNAAYDWAHWSNPLVMTPVSSSYATHMDFYGKPTSYWYPYNGVLGETKFYTSSGSTIDPNIGNWFYADIYLNNDSVYNYQGTAAHEMGHALGLAHWNSNPYSIMAQSSTRIVQVVQSIDNQHLNEKY